MSTLNKQYQRHFHDYMRIHGAKRADLTVVSEWMINTKRWEPEMKVLIRQCKARLGDALRQEYFIDGQGRRVRAMHPVVEVKAGKQTTLWEPLWEMPRKRAIVTFQQRRKQVVGDCRQLKTDVDSYNENFNDGKVIQLSLDFTNDILEDELARSSRKSTSIVPERPSVRSRTVPQRPVSSPVTSRH